MKTEDKQSDEILSALDKMEAESRKINERKAIQEEAIKKHIPKKKMLSQDEKVKLKTIKENRENWEGLIRISTLLMCGLVIFGIIYYSLSREERFEFWLGFVILFCSAGMALAKKKR